MATLRFTIHMEPLDGGIRWWAECEDLPGFFASAENLPELRDRYSAALADMHKHGKRVELGYRWIERLADMRTVYADSHGILLQVIRPCGTHEIPVAGSEPDTTASGSLTGKFELV